MEKDTGAALGPEGRAPLFPEDGCPGHRGALCLAEWEEPAEPAARGKALEPALPGGSISAPITKGPLSNPGYIFGGGRTSPSCC